MALKHYFRPDMVQDNFPSDLRHYDFAGKLLYFKDIDKSSPYHALNNHMIIVTAVEREENLLTGICLNKSIEPTLYEYMRYEDCTLTKKCNFVRIQQGNIDNFSLDNAYSITYLMRKDDALPIDKAVFFGKFVSHVATDPDEAILLARYVGDCPDDVIIADNATILKFTDLLGLVMNNNASIADADPDVIFQQSELMRTVHSFPQHFPLFTADRDTAPKPRM